MSACAPGQGGASPSASAGGSRSAAASVAPTVTAATATPATTPTPDAAVYTVKPGDTLSAIAAANKTTVDAIVKANNLTDPNKIQQGQKLVMPAEGEAPSPSGSASPAASGDASAQPSAASKPPPP